jgi:hypothetical protein
MVLGGLDCVTFSSKATVEVLLDGWISFGDLFFRTNKNATTAAANTAPARKTPTTIPTISTTFEFELPEVVPVARGVAVAVVGWNAPLEDTFSNCEHVKYQ